MAAMELAEYIKRQLEQRDMTVTEFASRAQLSRQSVYKILNAEFGQTRLTTFIQIATALKVHPIELFRVFFKRWEFPSSGIQQGITLCTGEDAAFVGDVNYPNHSVVSPGQVFTKTWEIRNVGRIPWTDRKLICLDQQLEVRLPNGTEANTASYGLSPLDGYEIAIPEIFPGENHQVNVRFEAPEEPCATLSYWKMADAEGNFLYPQKSGLYCVVQVTAF